jgi:hypothetical protein
LLESSSRMTCAGQPLAVMAEASVRIYPDDGVSKAHVSFAKVHVLNSMLTLAAWECGKP